MTEDEMVGWHHQLNGHEFEQTPGNSEAWHAAVHGVAKSQTNLASEQTHLMSRPPPAPLLDFLMNDC